MEVECGVHCLCLQEPPPTVAARPPPPPCPRPCRYLDGKTTMLYPEPRDVFPCNLIHSGALGGGVRAEGRGARKVGPLRARVDGRC